MAFLAGKRALIVGLATDRSIAWGIAEAMRREGAELAFTYQERMKDRVEELAGQVQSSIVLPMDVSFDEEIDRAFAALGQHWDRFDILVHSVAFAPREALAGAFVESTSRESFRVAHYSIQSDHVHLIVESAGMHSLACGMKSIAARVARAANRVFCRRGRVLADRYHLHILRTPSEVRRALAYVLLNTRRHLAKLGHRVPRRAPIDPASSGRWFAGWSLRIPFAVDEQPPPVASPRTWLLSVGWRRHGLIDPSEIPGVR